MTANHYGLYIMGYSCVTMKNTISCYKLLLLKQILKIFSITDYFLKLVFMKLKSLVIIYLARYGEFFLLF